MTDIREKFEHPSWFTFGGTAAGYLLVLTLMTVLLFAIPFLVFRFL
jgi:hypothetical protein